MLSPYHPLQLALGLSVWAAWFGINYGTLSLACRFTSFSVETGNIPWINLVLLAFSLLTTGLLLYWARRCWLAGRNGPKADSPPHRLIAHVGAGLHLTAAAAALSIGLVTLAIPPCV